MIARSFVAAFVLAWSSVAAAHADLSSGLAAHYRLDGNAKDSGPYHNNGKVFGGVAPTTDRFGNPDAAMLFNGTDGYILVPDAPSLNPKDQLTIAYWMRVDGFLDVWQSVVFKADPTGDCEDAREYTFWNNDGEWAHISSAGDGGCHHTLVGEPFDMLGHWNFIVEVIDRKSTHRMYLYVNGKLVKSADSYSTFYRSAYPLYIGWDIEPRSDQTHFKGALDDLRIYLRALSRAEVAELYRR